MNAAETILVLNGVTALVNLLARQLEAKGQYEGKEGTDAEQSEAMAALEAAIADAKQLLAR